MNVFLIGFMGSGKSTLGKMLASDLSLKYIDMDAEIESKHSLSIGEIFSKFGEEVFRKMEHELLLELIKTDNQVISAGGGVPCFHNNMEVMNKGGKSVYIRLSPQAVYNRLNSLSPESRAVRPLLAGKSPEQLMSYINTTLTKREPFYLQASKTIHCDGLDTNETYLLLKSVL
jgi:shikimate kinase